MATCDEAYAQQPYGTSPYGSGEYEGVQPRDIRLYYPAVGGGINLNAPITYIPPPTTDLSIVNFIRALTPAGENFFSDISGLKVGGIFISYHKLWIYNACEVASFTYAVIELDLSVDPNGYMSIAPVSVGAPLPMDGNERNTDGGDGPGAWQITPITLGIIPSLGASAIWIRRAVTVATDEQQYATPRFLISGKTEVSGEVCPP